MYDTDTKRMRHSSELTSTITAETVVVDGCARSPKDTAGFLHGNSEKQFAYGYLSGSNLLQTLSMPNNMTLTQSYESQRDLLTGMSYKRGNTPVAERRYSYAYDTMGRRATKKVTTNGSATRPLAIRKDSTRYAPSAINEFL
ncbi:MAG: hypothetical protein ACI4O9_02030 [Akkermansia sp.]